MQTSNPNRRFYQLNMLILTVLFLLTGFQTSFGQNKSYKMACVAFYNLENLFDTIDDPATDDSEFLPAGINQWTPSRYMEKLGNMANVISQIGDEYMKGGPTILGVSEIENKSVLVDLINTPALINSGYDIVHFNSPDARGVDVGLLYKKKDFTVLHANSHRLLMPGIPDFKSRDQLVVSGLLDGEKIHVIVNHWPSRRAGPEFRNEAGKLSRHIVDSLFAIDKDAKIFVMGDLNDDPVDPSVYIHLDAKGDEKKIGGSTLYNPMYPLYKDGIGSLAYRDSWNLFDQIILSKSLLGKDKTTFKLFKTMICNKPFLITKEGQYKGYPFRTFAAGAYIGGYSDHFPVYVFLVKEKQ